MAGNPTGLNRRSLAALLGLTALAGGSAPPPSADAALVAIGIEAARLRRERAALMPAWWKLKPGDPDIDEVGDKLEVPYERLWVLCDEATAIPATTLDGMRAKAELIRHFIIVDCEGPDGVMTFNSSDQELAWSLVCDMTGGA